MPLQAPDHLAIFYLVKRGIVVGDRVEVVWNFEDEQLIHLVADPVERTSGPHRERSQYPAWMKGPDGLGGSGERRAGRDPVIHQNHQSPRKLGQRLAAPVSLLLDSDFFPSADGPLLQGRSGQAQLSHSLHVEDHESRLGDRPHCILGIARGADLSHDETIQREMQSIGDDCRNDHTPSWQTEHDGARIVSISSESFSKEAAGLCAILKHV